MEPVTTAMDVLKVMQTLAEKVSPVTLRYDATPDFLASWIVETEFGAVVGGSPEIAMTKAIDLLAVHTQNQVNRGHLAMGRLAQIQNLKQVDE